jgi:hypothetical protein
MNWIDQMNEDMARRREEKKAKDQYFELRSACSRLGHIVLGEEGRSLRGKKIASTLGEEGRKQRAITREKNMKESGTRKEANLKRSKTLGEEGRKEVAFKTGNTKQNIIKENQEKVMSHLPDIFTKQMFLDLCDQLNFKHSLFENASRSKNFFFLFKNGNQFVGPTTYKKL